MASARRILIVGGGIAGVHAALGARAADPEAEIRVFSEEDCLPYDRTALSKDVLTAGIAPSEQLLFPQVHYEEQRVQLHCRARIVAVDPAQKRITTQTGATHGYDALILATGTRPRQLPGVDAQDVFYLRTHTDAIALQPRLKQARRLIVIGAGLIGLEVAAAARALGVEVDVLEAGDAILSRACDVHTATVIGGFHQREGVKIHTGARIVGIGRGAADSLRVQLASGERLEADLIVAGVGVVPNLALAEQAGIAVDDGILVDEFGRTSVADVYAAGDAAKLPLPFLAQPVRLETWRHAQDHGHFVGRNAAGEHAPFDAVPTFWSDQFGHRIQGAGLLDRSQTPILRAYEDGSHTSFLLDDAGRVRAAVGIDRPQDINGARRLIAAQLPIDSGLLADPGMPVPRIVKQLKSA
jgi:3-phenylpropionate/trans-cinnamate dioxygenase ferredoxin reductase subunit